MVERCFGVLVWSCDSLLGERRIDFRVGKVGILELAASSGAVIAARLFVETDRVKPCFAGLVLTVSNGTVGSCLFACACGSFEGDNGAAVEGRDTERTVLTLFERGRADSLFGVKPLSVARTEDAFVGEGGAFVGDRSLLDTGRGKVVDLLEEMSWSPSLRRRLEGASASCDEDVRMVLKGLMEVGRPVTGGGILVEGLFPAVLGRSGSFRSALEDDRFNDWAVGFAKPGRARKEEG